MVVEAAWTDRSVMCPPRSYLFSGEAEWCTDGMAVPGISLFPTATVTSWRQPSASSRVCLASRPSAPCCRPTRLPGNAKILHVEFDASNFLLHRGYNRCST